MSACICCSAIPPADTCRDIVARLEVLSSPETIAAEVGRDHELALTLWSVPIREARILASMIDERGAVTREQMDEWAASFDGWEICDQCGMNLFRHIDEVERIAVEWGRHREEYAKRAGYVLMATLAVHRKEATDGFFEGFPAIMQSGDDDRRYVKKAVSWALRQLGKRNARLNRAAVAVAEELGQRDSTVARWIARDAVRELTSEQVQRRLRQR